MWSRCGFFLQVKRVGYVKNRKEQKAHRCRYSNIKAMNVQYNELESCSKTLYEEELHHHVGVQLRRSETAAIWPPSQLLTTPRDRRPSTL